LLTDDQCEIIIIQFEVAVFITEVVDVAGFSAIFIGKVAEFKSLFQQGIPVYLGFAPWVQFSENTAIFAENVVDVPHKVGGIAILPVVKSTPAVIRTESFVLAAVKAFFTDQAFFFLHVLSGVL
jgi:hypothetical protein